MAETDKPRPNPNHLLRQARLEQGLTEVALAKQIGASKVSISRWENDSSKKPDPHFNRRLLEVLKKQSIQELGLGLEDEKHVPQQSSQTNDTTSEEGHSQKPSIWSMPRRNPFFTGREDILERLYRTLTSTEKGQSPRPVAITGLGGMGKTQTLIEYAWRHRSDYQVVYWARADDTDTLAAAFERIAQVLNLPEATSPDQKQTIAAFKAWLNEQPRWLLILDNVETPETLQMFLPEEPQGHILMTSRAQAMGTIAQKIDLSGMELEEGAWFLLRRAQKIAFDASFGTASPPDQQRARAISHDLGGLPLALEQAGAYIEETGCGLPGYRERYREQHAELLKRRGSLSDPEYPWTVATTWTLSFARLKQINLAAAELLCFLACLTLDAIPLSFIRKAAPHLPRHLRRAAGNAVKLDGVIGDLRRFSLVQRHEEDEALMRGETLSIHPLVQTVLKDTMPQKIRRWWAERTVKAAHGAIAVVSVSLAHACAVLIEEWGLVSKEAADLLYQAGCQAQDLQLNRSAGLLHLQALPICERVCKTKSMPVVNCLIRIAQVYQAREKFEEAELYYQRALDIRTQLRGSAHPTVAWCKFRLGRLYVQQRNFEQAEAIYQELLEQKPSHSTVLEASAALYVKQKRYAEAEALIRQALDMLRSRLEPAQPAYIKVTTITKDLANIYMKQGKTTEAETLLQQELATLGSVLGPTDYQIMTISEHLASIYMKQDKRTEAEALLRRIITLRQQSLDKDAEQGVAIARNLLPLAEILEVNGVHEEAEVLFRRTLAIVDKHEVWERPLLLEILMSYASFLILMEREEEAERLMVRFNAVYEDMESAKAYWKAWMHYRNEGELPGDDPIDSPP
jgi:tetratricopeptide (TPR) repeat protein/transcriptional regulator with XRE-family HTH domain